MFDVYDSEAIVKVYRMLKKKCDAIDNFINNHSMYYGPDTGEFGSLEVLNNIVDLMARKNQLINLKVIVDTAIKHLNENVQKVLFLKMNYNISMSELCGILEMKERTAFRWVERAFSDLTSAINHSPYRDKLKRIMEEESWIDQIRNSVKDRREAYKIRGFANNL